MPRVPMPDGPMAQPNGPIQGRLVAPEISPYAARQAEAMGNALQGAGGEMAKIATDMQQQANALRTTDALNQLKETALALQHDKDTGFLSVKGKDTFDRPDGRSLTDVYGEQLSSRANEISASLGNDAQRALFQRHAGEMMTSFKGQVMAHEAQEYKGYQLSVAEGVQATALRDIGLNWRNPEAVDAAVLRIKSEVYRQAQLAGKSAEWQEAQARKLASNGHKVALLAALDQNDANYADAYLKKYSGQMDADDILAVRGHITKAVDTKIGMGVAQDVAGKAVAKAAPTDADRVIAITIQSESGGNPNAVSPAGARGRMQVMPETAKNPGFGIKPSDGTPEDDERVGRELIQHNVKRYAGDLGKAWAAYNAGGGWVDKAVERAGKATPGTPEADWFWQLNHDARSPANRQQTQDYVTKNLALYNAGGGAGPRPTFADIDASLRADPRLAGNPARYKIAREEANRQYEVQTKAIQQKKDETYGQVLQGLIANGGNFNALPQALVISLAQQDPAKYDDAMAFAGKLSKGADVNDKAVWAGILDTPPQVLAQMSKSQFLAKYGDKLDAAHLEKGYALLDSAQGGKGGPHEGGLLNNKDRLMRMAAQLKIYPEDSKKATQQQREDLGRFYDEADLRVRTFEKNDLSGKRNATGDEIQKILDGMALDKVKLSRWGADPEKAASALSADEAKDAYVTVKNPKGQDVDVRLSAIPADVRGAIVAAQRRAGVPVTESGIARYWVEAGQPKSMSAPAAAPVPAALALTASPPAASAPRAQPTAPTPAPAAAPVDFYATRAQANAKRKAEDDAREAKRAEQQAKLSAQLRNFGTPDFGVK